MNDERKYQDRIGPDFQVRKHGEALIWLNDLLTDLKLVLAGMEPTLPITFDRLQEWPDKYYRELANCKESYRILR